MDVEGRRYIDGISGVFAASLGHGNDEIVDAIAEQLRRLAFSSPIMTTSDRTLELAAEVLGLAGGRYSRRAVQQAARRRGLLVRASPHNTTLAPPLVITSEEVDEVAGALEDAVDEVGRLVEANGAVDVEVTFGV